MVEIIKFPGNYCRSKRLDGSTRHRCILALEFVSKTIRSGEVTPTEMFVMYSSRNEAETIWSYLNLGFDPDGLTKAMCRVLNDVEARKGDARLDAKRDDGDWR